MGKFSLRISAALVQAIRGANSPMWRIAVAADLDPTVLSKLMRGQQRVRENDARVLAVARVIGFPEDEAIEACPESP